MTYLNLIKSGYTASLAALFMALQLSACSSGGGGGDNTVATGSASVSWARPTLREDNSTLPVEEIAGYRVYYGSASEDYQRDIDVVSDGSSNGTVTVDGLDVGSTYYFVVTAYDTEGRESLYSSPPIEITIQ